MDRSKLRDNDSGRKGSKKRAAVSKRGERLSRAPPIGAWGETRRLDDILVPHREGIENKEVKMEHLVKVQSVRNVAAYQPV